MEKPEYTPPAIGEIADPTQIRVLLFINNRQVHVSLPELVKHLQDQLDDHEARIAALETP